ncbi:BsuBI/PstI family type II restriction endonuclease [Pseudomonas sp. V88_4]|uniref:BsuBI/PstI family type II restriction endonuclease n=1 Tax=Pseudomonas sp. V88_4 TaxID=3044229 RepID=UPI00249EC951|nr:BsuBI/PstI family type II restriction endonuclease [Pseudomonas sp. V88_4]MDI3398509.1 BsuBI/PstI family type II restriction endonuclease [Pseudomonas sp. V88_4]
MFQSLIPSVALIYERLPEIFPEGTENRNYVVREMAARAIFVMFYTGAIDGAERWIRPSQVTGMSDEQAVLVDEGSRAAWVTMSLEQKNWRTSSAWYAENSREPVRDETLRNGLVALRAVVERPGVPTTSSKPKYALEKEFAGLFDPNLVGSDLERMITLWQESHLSKAAISRFRLVKHGATLAVDAVKVNFPNGEFRSLAPGASSAIAKAVIEVFAPRFLKHPAILWLSESGNKVVARDEALANALGLKIDASKALPDVILVDLGSDIGGADMKVVFTEVVATDGPINRERKTALTRLALEAGFVEQQLLFLTAFMDRASGPFRKSIAELAWGSYAWCVSEPDNIIELRDSLFVNCLVGETGSNSFL